MANRHCYIMLQGRRQGKNRNLERICIWLLLLGSSVHHGMWTWRGCWALLVRATRQKPTRPCRAVCLPAPAPGQAWPAGNEQKNSGANTRTAPDPAAAAAPLGNLHVCCIFFPSSFSCFITVRMWYFSLVLYVCIECIVLWGFVLSTAMI